jgi:trans-2,3-dihydro-3-hydroxyanthranilate isomerase
MPVNIRLEQEYKINRPSLVYSRAVKYRDIIDVDVGGKVVMVAKGHLL